MNFIRKKRHCEKWKVALNRATDEWAILEITKLPAANEQVKIMSRIKLKCEFEIFIFSCFASTISKSSGITKLVKIYFI